MNFSSTVLILIKNLILIKIKKILNNYILFFIENIE